MIIRMNDYEMTFIICTLDNLAARYVFACTIVSNNTFVNAVTKAKKCSFISYFRSISRIYGVTLPGPSPKSRLLNLNMVFGTDKGYLS